MLRIAAQTRYDRSKRLVLPCCSCYLSLNANLTHYHSPPKEGVRVYLSMCVYTNEYGTIIGNLSVWLYKNVSRIHIVIFLTGKYMLEADVTQYIYIQFAAGQHFLINLTSHSTGIMWDVNLACDWVFRAFENEWFLLRHGLSYRFFFPPFCRNTVNTMGLFH